MFDKSNSPVFVTGVERSGSSLIARIIAMCGAFSGQTTSMCENSNIKAIVDFYYKQLGIDLRGQYPLPNTMELPIPSDWKNRVSSALSKDGYSSEKLWMYKGSRVGQIWPVWNYSYPNAKWIIVRRRTGDVVESCMRTGFMNAYGDRTIQQLVGVSTERDGWLWWIHEHEKLFREMIETGLNVKVIWPERMLGGDFQQIHEMLHWLDLPWNEGIISLLEVTLIKSKK